MLPFSKARPNWLDVSDRMPKLTRGNRACIASTRSGSHVKLIVSITPIRIDP